jgi:crotonobetainyl-CoA:carnitine CoA-transferase CaiB-like acyl-CoA transferase
MPGVSLECDGANLLPSTVLSGIRVLDLSRVLAAPLAAQLLGDLGAEVVKVERPGRGDESRGYGPPFLPAGDDQQAPDAAFYLACNRNKRSITVDLAHSEGQAIIRRLAAESDVVIENFKTGGLARYGLDYAALSAINPRLIYCSITGFGQDGPLARKPGYDGVFQAMSGFMNVSGHPDDAPGGGPMKVGISIVDILTSLYAANAIQAALYERDMRSGKGQHIDLSLLDCGLASLSHFAMNYLVSGEIPERRGNGGFGGVPSQAFQCADGQIFLVAGGDHQFIALCDAIGRPDLPRDPRFSRTSARIENRRALVAELDAVFAGGPAQDWLARLDAAHVPASPVNDIAQALAEPQIRHRRMVREVEHASGPVQLLANPIVFSASPIGDYAAPPLLGQHTDDILSELGLGPDRVAELRAQAVI